MHQTSLDLVLRIIVFMLPGLFAGWLLNYLADTLPVHRRFVAPACANCQADLPPGAFIGYYSGLQRCPACRARPNVRSLVIAAFTAAGFIWIGFSPPIRLGLWAGWFWFAFLLLVTVIDIERAIIMHPMAVFGAVIAVINGVQLHGWISTLIGGLVGVAVMLFFYYMGIAYARWSSRKHGREIAEGEALGFGDVTFSGVLGLLMGWPGVIGELTFAVLIGGAVGLISLIPMIFRRHYDPNLALPYGPYLAAAAFYLLFLQ